MHFVSSFIFIELVSVCVAAKTMLVLPSTSRLDHVTASTKSMSGRLDRSYDDIMKGLSLALAECQRQFKWQQWNCPVSLSSVLSTSYMNTVNRQTAYLQAITSAGITHHVTKMCGKTGGRYCGCGKIEETAFSRDIQFNCSVNVVFGRRVSVAFLRPYTDTDPVKRAVKRHNEQVGNEYVKETQVMHCKCMGPTGGCTYKTCWRKLARFRKISDILKEKYFEAWDLRRADNPFRVKDGKRKLKRMLKDDLVFMETSPDFCVRNDSLGLPGTWGRECEPIGKVPDTYDEEWERYSFSCRHMCLGCEYNVTEVASEEKSECDCKFKWCCSVNCRQCMKTVTRYYCK